MISRLSADDNGVYTCTAQYSNAGQIPGGQNIIAHTTLANISLTLNGKIVALIPNDIYVSGSVIATSSVVEQIGNNATLQCTFTGYLPVNYEIIWRFESGQSLDNDTSGKYIINEDFNGMGQSQNGGDTIDNGVISELTVISLTDSDIGRYTCHMNGSNLTATIQLISKYTLSIVVVILSNSLFKFIMCYFIVPISTAVSIGLTSSINVSVIPPSTSTDNTISVIIGITVPVVIIIATVSIVAMVTVVIVVVKNVKRQTSTEIPDHSIDVLDNAAYGISNTAVNEVVYEDIPQFDYEKPYDL